MERISSLVTLLSQSSQLVRHKHMMKIYQELTTSDFLEPDIIRDVVSCVGGSLSGISYEELASIFDPLLRIIVRTPNRSNSNRSVQQVSRYIRDAYWVVVHNIRQTSHVAQSTKAVACSDVIIWVRLHMMVEQQQLIASHVIDLAAVEASMGDFDLQAHSAALLLRLVPHDCQKELAAKYIAPVPHKLSRDFSKVGGECFEKNDTSCELDDVQLGGKLGKGVKGAFMYLVRLIFKDKVFLALPTPWRRRLTDKRHQ
ncbi:hypothetical protein CLF_104679 [Clonorchis sinensis]|uniref:Uncharacterized protein n=1 Tax=Clonorchis sinensis TaxID=79923 RepID=G7YC37_CLOSI|nr:hypothetical protein CLF_104679 [Clonorchis sinensis]